MFREFTSTCYLIDQEKFLLLFHPKHQKWLPPGGHLEKNETPPETARREVKEETGLDIIFLKQENLWVSDWNAVSIERPFSCLLETIPKTKNHPAHEHVDFIFVAKPIGGALKEGKWFTPEEIYALTTHDEIFSDTQKTVEKILIQLPVLTKEVLETTFQKS